MSFPGILASMVTMVVLVLKHRYFFFYFIVFLHSVEQKVCALFEIGANNCTFLFTNTELVPNFRKLNNVFIQIKL